MELIVDVVSRSNKPIERHRFTGRSCRIGRAYDNDIILTEPHISPHHAIIEEDELGQWWLMDLGSRNGVRSRNHQRLESPQRINSGDEVMFGKLHVRFYAPAHPVDEALAMGASENALQCLSQPLPFIAFVLISISLFAGYEYLQTYNEWDAREFLPRALGTPLAGILWAGLWAIAGRVLRHEPRFVAQCIVSFSYLLLVQLLELVVQTVAFNTGDVLLTHALIYLLHGALFSLLLLFNLRLATYQHQLARVLTSSAIAWGVVGTVWLFTHFSKPAFSNQPNYVGVLQPSFMQWQKPLDSEQFLQQAQWLFENTRQE